MPNAPKVTPEDIEATIVAENYLNLGDAACRTGQPDTEAMHRTTLCMLTLRNGFMVTGESACVDIRNYDVEIGRQIARRNAVEKVWMLEGYLLRDRLFNAGETA